MCVVATIRHQLGAAMGQQVGLRFEYESTTTSGATALAGLPLYFELAHVLALGKQIRAFVPVRAGCDPDVPDAGWSDFTNIVTLVALNLARGESVADLDLLRKDEGFVRFARSVACAGLRRRERRAKERLLTKSGDVPIPSQSAVFRFLRSFHGPEQGVARKPGEAIIVPEHARLRGLWQVVASLLGVMQKHQPQEVVTLDGDATLVETHKAEALRCYKGFKAYQPLNVYLPCWGMVLYSQFQDGNVPCGKDQLAVLVRALELIPAGVRKVMLRMDTQGYEWELLRYLAEGKNERFGVIEFAVGADVTPELKKEVAKLRPSAWKDLPRQQGEVTQQWAEVPFVPNASATRKDGPAYRFVVTREALRQPSLPGVQSELPFPTMEFAELGQCKLHAIVTNRKLGGSELVDWYWQRCGKSEEAHSVMKSDLAGGRMPSGDFGANAAWWTIMLLSLNLNELFKRLAMGEGWVTKRLKAIRLHVIGVAARVVEHSRQVVLRLSAGHTSTALMLLARERILALAVEPEVAASG